MTETFHILPGSARTLWLLPTILVATVVTVGVVILASARGARSTSFEVSPAGLRIRGDLYGRMIPAAAIQVAAARPVDLTTERDLQPTMRTMGTGLPGYKAGWFRLRNGQKALLYVTDKSRVAYIPTTAGYAVLLSVPDPAAFVASLNRELATHR